MRSSQQNISIYPYNLYLFNLYLKSFPCFHSPNFISPNRKEDRKIKETQLPKLFNLYRKSLSHFQNFLGIQTVNKTGRTKETQLPKVFNFQLKSLSFPFLKISQRPNSEEHRTNKRDPITKIFNLYLKNKNHFLSHFQNFLSNQTKRKTGKTKIRPTYQKGTKCSLDPDSSPFLPDNPKIFGRSSNHSGYSSCISI